MSELPTPSAPTPPPRAGKVETVAERNKRNGEKGGKSRWVDNTVGASDSVIPDTPAAQVETVSERNKRNGKKGGGHNKKEESDGTLCPTAFSDAPAAQAKPKPETKTAMETMMEVAVASATPLNTLLWG